MLITLFGLVASLSLQQVPLAAQGNEPYFAKGNFQQMDQHGSAVPRIRALCRTVAPLSVRALEDAQDRLASAASRSPSDTTQATLGCIRATLFAKDALGREGPGMLPGVSWAAGAVVALMQQLEQRPDDALAAELLGVVTQEALPSQHPAFREPARLRGQLDITDLPTIAAMLYQAVRLGARSPGLLRSCASLMIDIGDHVTAHDCSMLALAAGHDSTWHLLRMARLAFTSADTTSGLAFIDGAARASHDSAARAELGWHLVPDWPANKGAIDAGALNPGNRHIQIVGDRLTTAELAEWFELPSHDVAAWIRKAMEARLPIQHTEGYNRLHRLAPSTLTAMWRSGSLLTRNFIAHFWYISYAGGTFRHCYRDLDRSSCATLPNPDGSHHLRMVARVAHLWDPLTGRPSDLLTYAVPTSDLLPTSDGPDRSATLAVDFRRWMIGGGSTDTVFSRQIGLSPGDQSGGAYLGFEMVPGSGFSSWSVMATQVGLLRRGGLYADRPPDPPGSGLQLSDLIIGVGDGPLTWNSGTRKVPLTPMQVLGREDPLQLYYQVKNDGEQVPVKVGIVVRRLVDGVPAEGQVSQITFDAVFGSGIIEAQREVGLSNLASGSYELALVLSDAQGIVARRAITLTVQ